MKQSAWVEWKGEYYYVGTDGVMLTSTTTPDGYKVDASGKWVK
jgi:D-alanyl-D-alanine carboxypeptidase